MFSRSIVCLILGMLISSLGFAAYDERERFSRFILGEYVLVDETGPVLARGSNGSLKMIEPKKFAGLKITETEKPYIYKISFEGESVRSDLKINSSKDDLKITDFDTLEIKAIKFGELVVTRWSNSETGESVEIVVNDTLSPYTPGKGLSLFTQNGDDIQIYLEKKPRPVIRVAYEDRATLFMNRSLSCTEVAAAACRHGGDAMERAYCAVDVEKECRAVREADAKAR